MQLEQYLEWIRRLPKTGKLTKEQLLVAETLVAREEGLAMYYAPHNEVVNEQAEVVIVGITPGWTQMELAYRSVRDDLHTGGFTPQQLADRAKRLAGLAGSMRSNVISMLDRAGLPEVWGLESTGELFEAKRDLLHTTSLLKHPVFIHGVNYTGHQPPIERSVLLQHYAYEVFPKEVERLKQTRLWIPLGTTVSDIFTTLVRRGVLSGDRCLFGFPHPSGANGHRHRQFEEGREQFRFRIREAWGRA